MEGITFVLNLILYAKFLVSGYKPIS